MHSLKFISWYETFLGEDGPKVYAETVLDKREMRTVHMFQISGSEITVEDAILQKDDKVKVIRRVRSNGKADTGIEKNGIAFGMEILLGEGKQLRYGIPSCRYSSGQAGKHTYMEERLTAPVIMAYDESARTAVSVARTRPPADTGKEERKTGDSRYLHETEVGSLGYEWQEGRENILCARWPYE